MTKSGSDERTRELHKAYASNDPAQTSAVYDDWSADYEAHMQGAGYAHPAMVAAMLTRHQPPGGEPVLDAGAGTGIMGEILTALGYPNVHGFDASQGMLARAAAREVYRDLRHGMLGERLDYEDDSFADLRHGMLGERLDYEDDSFAATIASGVFTQGHAPLDGLDELVRVTRPGGHIVFSVSRIYLGEAIEAKARTLGDAGKWRKADVSERYDSTPLGDDVLISQVYAFEVL
jgi:SAM-dependent methyltransferase